MSRFWSKKQKSTTQPDTESVQEATCNEGEHKHDGTMSQRHTSLTRHGKHRQQVRKRPDANDDKARAISSGLDQFPETAGSSTNLTVAKTEIHERNTTFTSITKTLPETHAQLGSFRQQLALPRGHVPDDPEAEDSGVEEYHYNDAEDDGQESRISQASDSEANKKIRHIIAELLSTEEVYVAKLTMLFEIWKRTSDIVNEDVAKEMFPNIKAIYALHHDNLLPALRDRVKSWEMSGRIGDVMCRLTPFLKLYTEYVKNFQTASQIVQNWKEKSASFCKLLKSFPTRIPGDLGIAALMIEPVQRVPRYELLLKDYLKRLPAGSEDTPDTRKALELVSEAAEHFEKMMQRDAQISTLSQLQSSLVGGRNIFSLSRKLIKKVLVYQIDANTAHREECNLYLLSDLLLITKDLMGATGSRRQRTKHMIDLTKIQVNPCTTRSLRPGLAISTRSVTVEVGFRNDEELGEVKQLLHIQMAETTKRKLRKRGTWNDMDSNKTTTLGARAPQLVPPHTVSVCMVCGQQFTSPKKKKHCAACGMVVCGKCSMHQMELDYDVSTPQRVCQKCHHVLLHQRHLSSP